MTAPAWRPSSASSSWCASGAGRVRALEELLETQPAAGGCGISHTRWATHGPATDRNAHPHLGGRGGAATVAVVHNGVIENHAALRRELESQGFAFASQTDTEVIAHLIARELETTDDLFEAVQRALPHLEGTYGLGVVSPRRPGEVIGARFGSPLVVGPGRGRAPARQRPGRDRAAHGDASPSSRTARSSGSRRTTSRCGTGSTGRSRRGSTGSTGSPTPSSWAGTRTT